MRELTFYNSTGEKIDTESGAVLNTEDETIKKVVLSGLKLDIDPEDRRVRVFFRARKNVHDRSEQFLAEYINTETTRPLIELSAGVKQHIEQWGFEHAPMDRDKQDPLLELMETPQQSKFPTDHIDQAVLERQIETDQQTHVDVAGNKTALGILSALGGDCSVVITSKRDTAEFYHDLIVSVDDEFEHPEIISG